MNVFCPIANGSRDESVHPFWYAIAPPKPTVSSEAAISRPRMPAKTPTRRRRDDALPALGAQATRPQHFEREVVAPRVARRRAHP